MIGFNDVDSPRSGSSSSVSADPKTVRHLMLQEQRLRKQHELELQQQRLRLEEEFTRRLADERRRGASRVEEAIARAGSEGGRGDAEEALAKLEREREEWQREKSALKAEAERGYADLYQDMTRKTRTIVERLKSQVRAATEEVGIVFVTFRVLSRLQKLMRSLLLSTPFLFHTGNAGQAGRSSIGGASTSLRNKQRKCGGSA